MPTQIRSHAKINLGLAIGPTRPDGYHGLVTIYQTLAVHDVVTVEARPAARTALHLTTNDARVPTDARNTAWRMVESALSAIQRTAEVHVRIVKNLPIQGGLGAGSANAVAALIGLEQELHLRLPDQDRLQLAAAIGSDVPLFLVGGTILGVGRGEEVYPLPDLPPTWCVVAAPRLGVSTPQAFRAWDQRPPSNESPARNSALRLTALTNSDRLKELSRTLASGLVPVESHSSGVFPLREDRPENPLLALVRTGIENDFERVVFAQYPSLGNIKRLLAISGSASAGASSLASDLSGAEDAWYAALSGSGSALFGLYGTEGAAKVALGRLKAGGIQGFLTQTISRDDYWREMVLPAQDGGA